jgi:predicted small secreted protein
MIRKVMSAALISSAFLGLSACNTVRGAGRDIESIGDISHCQTKVVWRDHRRVRVCR